MSYANIFAPVSVELSHMFTSVLPIALGIFAVVIAIRLGTRLLTEFTGGDDEDEDDED